jgi:putative peptidoglycan lipid II flippase
MLSFSIFQRFIMRWRDAHADYRKITLNILVLSLFLIIAKIIAAGKEMVVAWKYGTSATIDAYLFAYNLVNLPVSIWMSVIFVVLIPLATKISKNDHQGLIKFRAELLAVTIVVGVCGYWGILKAIGFLVEFDICGLDSITKKIVLEMAPGIALIFPLGIITVLWSVWTMVRGSNWNTLYEGIPAGGILIATLFFPPAADILIWGTVGGFLAQALCLLFPLVRSGNFELPQWRLDSVHWDPFRRGFITVLGAQVIMATTGILDQFIAARLGEGSIATIGYASRIIALILGLLVSTVGRATFPIFSNAAIEDENHLIRLVRRWSLIMIGSGLIIAIIVLQFSESIIRIIFERGAFSSSDTQAVSNVLKYSALTIPFYAACNVLYAGINARRNYMALLIIYFIALTSKVIFLYIFVPWLRIAGIPLSSAMMQIIVFIGFWVLFFRGKVKIGFTTSEN